MIRKNSQGFTLIELMIVVAIIAIIAAIAIPSLLRSRIAANESSAVGTLRSLVSVESTWRQTDTDRNTISDYWTADVSGMYAVLNLAGNAVAAIDVAVGSADTAKEGAAVGTPAAPASNRAAAVAGIAVPGAGVAAATLGPLDRTASKSGYFITSLVTDPNANAYETDPDANTQTWTNTGVFGFHCWPETYDSTGVNKFVVSESGVIYGQDFGNNTPVTVYPAVNPTTVGWRVVQ